MNGVVLPGVVGEQDVVDVVVGLAGQLELGESVVAGLAVRAPPHGETYGQRRQGRLQNGRDRGSKALLGVFRPCEQ